MLKNNFKKNFIEAGIDEVARGCLFGRVYSAAVVWREEKDLDNLLNILNKKKMTIKDSKKLKPNQREQLKKYIETFALDYSIGWATEKEIDKLNIRNATFKAMHRALDNLTLKPEHLIVDGNDFEIYKTIPHQCIVKGDDKYTSIAAASILAKVYHDNYIKELVKKEPSLKQYDLLNNMGYGTKKHLDTIKKRGISKYHRKTFGICKKYKKLIYFLINLFFN